MFPSLSQEISWIITVKKKNSILSQGNCYSHFGTLSTYTHQISKVRNLKNLWITFRGVQKMFTTSPLLTKRPEFCFFNNVEFFSVWTKYCGIYINLLIIQKAAQRNSSIFTTVIIMNLCISSSIILLKGELFLEYYRSMGKSIIIYTFSFLFWIKLFLVHGISLSGTCISRFFQSGINIL